MPKGYLTTHVLDTAKGCPAAGVKLSLFRMSDTGQQKIAETVTNDDGRTDAPLLSSESFEVGTYEILFEVGDYFDAQGTSSPSPRFLQEIPIRFGISDADSHYHVPLLVSPFSYATYRGS